MNILDLLEIRTKYAIGSRTADKWIEQVVKSNEEEVYIVLTENSLNQYRNNGEWVIALLEKYNLKAMFDLKNPYTNTNVNFFLYVFSKKQFDVIQYGLYNEAIKNRMSKSEELCLGDEYPEDYLDYLDNIEKYVETNTCPSDTNKAEFGKFNVELRDCKCWNPKRYCKTALKVKEYLKKEKTTILSDVAEIIKPRPDEERRRTQYCAMPGTWQYPVDYTKFRDGVITNCILRKGDIVFLDKARMFLVYDDPKFELHTSPNCFVIRPKEISSEYLFTYLSSETAQVILDGVSSGTVISRIRTADLGAFPIIIPNRDDEFYRNVFYKENFPINDIAEIYNVILEASDIKQEEVLEDILDLELISKLKVYKEEVKERIIDEDLREINVCFRYKAYKAALILTGSVLEAVLIDWLSEIKGENYFEKDYMVQDRYHNNRMKKAELIDYINEIKYIEKPHWIDEADKAHKIRKKRNQVHAKLCLKSEEINEDLCREVIGYLEDVLRTRNGKLNMGKLKR